MANTTQKKPTFIDHFRASVKNYEYQARAMQRKKPTWSERFWKWFCRQGAVDHGSEQLPTGGTENPWDEAGKENDELPKAKPWSYEEEIKELKAELEVTEAAFEMVCAARDQRVAERNQIRAEAEVLFDKLGMQYSIVGYLEGQVAEWKQKWENERVRRQIVTSTVIQGYQPVADRVEPGDLKPPRGDTAIVSALEAVSVDAMA